MIVGPEAAYVVGTGASTPVGRDALSSAAAVRAGISGFAQHPYLLDSTGQPMRAAMIPWMDVDFQGPQRFEALLIPAVRQALAPLDRRDGGIHLALALGLPAPRPGLPVDLDSRLRHALANEFSGRFSTIGILPVGHAAGVLALYAACNGFLAGSFDACIVAGVESYIEGDTLKWLEASEQLHGAGPMNNAWGFVPGEAAGALLVVREDTAASLGLEPLAQILSIGRALEASPIKTDRVCTGEGLTDAFREALEGLPAGGTVTDVFCDLNGEPYRADEFGFAVLRTKESFASASDFVAAADCWGDVSAASAPLNVMLSIVAMQKSYASGQHSMVWASSESGERGAALLTRARPELN